MNNIIMMSFALMLLIETQVGSNFFLFVKLPSIYHTHMSYLIKVFKDIIQHLISGRYNVTREKRKRINFFGTHKVDYARWTPINQEIRHIEKTKKSGNSFCSESSFPENLPVLYSNASKIRIGPDQLHKQNNERINVLSRG